MNTSLQITWDAPMDPNGVVTYELNITVSDLATENSSVLAGLILRNDSNRFVDIPLEFVEPYANYSVSIFAMTNGGFSDVVRNNTITAQGGMPIILYQSQNWWDL